MAVNACDETALLSAEAARGYGFAKWADGNTDNPRTIEVSKDITIVAIFEPLLVGKCGKDSALTWTLDTTNMALEITGKGELTDNYTYIYTAESVIIGNDITVIGEYAFEDFHWTKNFIIGSSVKVIERDAFNDINYVGKEYGYEEYFYSPITCYAQRPPTVRDEAFDTRMPYSTIIYVPADYLSTYKAHDFWGLYDVRPLGAISVETSEVTVEPETTSANVVWPVVSGAATYELVIKDKDGNVVCTLVFNAQGQLTSIAFSAPGRGKAPQQAQQAGFSFTVTGLETGTTYKYSLTSKDGSGNVIDIKQGTFTTEGQTAVENVSDANTPVLPRKIIEEGHIYILLSDGTRYNALGTKVK